MTVVDVATDPLFTGRARAVVLAGSGSRGPRCAQHADADGPAPVGVVPAHLPRPAKALSTVQARTPGDMGAEAGRRPARHGRTVVRDAVAHLHRQALGHRAAREER